MRLSIDEFMCQVLIEVLYNFKLILEFADPLCLLHNILRVTHQNNSVVLFILLSIMFLFLNFYAEFAVSELFLLLF